jgi:hypothetical protein
MRNILPDMDLWEADAKQMAIVPIIQVRGAVPQCAGSKKKQMQSQVSSLLMIG